MSLDNTLSLTLRAVGSNFSPVLAHLKTKKEKEDIKCPRNQKDGHRRNREKIKAHRPQRTWSFLSNTPILWPFQRLP